MRLCVAWSILSLFTLAVSVANAADSDLVDSGDFWDSDDPVEPLQPPPAPKTPAVDARQATVHESDHQVPVATSLEPVPAVSLGINKSTSSSKYFWGRTGASRGPYFVEAVFALVAAWFVAGIFTGKEANSKLVKAWSDMHLREGGILERNFAQLGAGDGKSSELVIRENSKTFKFWASGRRHCQGLKAELLLQPRQDLLMRLIRLVAPVDDLVDIEVPMNEASMPLVVLAIGTPKLAREMQRELEDVHDLTHRIDVSRNPRGSHHWATDKFVVLAEHSGLVQDLIPDAAVEHIFSWAAFQEVGKYFRYLHITSEFPGKGRKQMIRCCLQLPPAELMARSSTLLSFLMLLIDTVGNYKLTGEQRKKAEKARTEVERKAWKEQAEDRNSKIQERKEKKMQEETERAKKAGPEAYAKLMEKRKKLEQKRSLGKLMKVVK